MHGFVDLDELESTGLGSDNIIYQDVGRSGKDMDNIWANVSFDLLADSIDLARQFHASSVIVVLRDVLHEVYRSSMLSAEQISRAMQMMKAGQEYLLKWVFGFDDKEKKSSEAVKNHTKCITEAMSADEDFKRMTMTEIERRNAAWEEDRRYWSQGQG
jgi:hypothetical protein